MSESELASMPALINLAPQESSLIPWNANVRFLCTLYIEHRFNQCPSRFNCHAPLQSQPVKCRLATHLNKLKLSFVLIGLVKSLDPQPAPFPCPFYLPLFPFCCSLHDPHPSCLCLLLFPSPFLSLFPDPFPCRVLFPCLSEPPVITIAKLWYQDNFY